VSTLLVRIDRDSVSAGDDASRTSHDRGPKPKPRWRIARAGAGRGAAGIDFRRRSHLAGRQRRRWPGCIGVLAQQWPAPRWLLDSRTTVQGHFGARALSLYFRYWCQASPEAVYSALLLGEPLPPKY
jgi:hypothetical protein